MYFLLQITVSQMLMVILVRTDRNAEHDIETGGKAILALKW